MVLKYLGSNKVINYIQGVLKQHNFKNHGLFVGWIMIDVVTIIRQYTCILNLKILLINHNALTQQNLSVERTLNDLEQWRCVVTAVSKSIYYTYVFTKEKVEYLQKITRC